MWASVHVMMATILPLVNSKDTASIIMAPSYLMAALHGELMVNVSWTIPEAATLTIDRIFATTSTTLVYTNGTSAVVLNNWVGKATVAVSDHDNDTAEMSMALVLINVALEDEGDYRIHLAVNGSDTEHETIYNTATLRIQTYAKPIYLHLATDTTYYEEHDEAVFTCTGNVGRPLGQLRLLQSTIPYLDYFYSISTDAYETTEAQTSLTPFPNGTYLTTYSFTLNVSRHENGSRFMCDVTHEIPEYSITKSNQISINVNCYQAFRDKLTTMGCAGFDSYPHNLPACESDLLTQGPRLCLVLQWTCYIFYLVSVIKIYSVLRKCAVVPQF